MTSEQWRPSHQFLYDLTPADLLERAIQCLSSLRYECDVQGTWLPVRDNPIWSVEGTNANWNRAPVCTDAAVNAPWIALTDPGFGAVLTSILLQEQTRLRPYATWDDANERLGATEMFCRYVISRYHDVREAM